MLKKCKERVKAYGLMAKAEFIQADFLKWKAPSPKHYDCAVIGFLLGHFMTIQEAKFFDKLQVILKPKGKLLLIDNTWSKWRAKDEHKEDIERRTLSDGRQFAIYKKYFEEEEIVDLLEKYQIKVEKVCWGLNFFGIIGELQ